jgi:hypothetical protein
MGAYKNMNVLDGFSLVRIEGGRLSTICVCHAGCVSVTSISSRADDRVEVTARRAALNQKRDLSDHHQGFGSFSIFTEVDWKAI